MHNGLRIPKPKISFLIQLLATVPSSGLLAVVSREVITDSRHYPRGNFFLGFYLNKMVSSLGLRAFPSLFSISTFPLP